MSKRISIGHDDDCDINPNLNTYEEETKTLKVLITIDLYDVTLDQRDYFYAILKDRNWVKIDGLTTAWQVVFKSYVDRSYAYEVLVSRLTEAKMETNVHRVNYAFQMDDQAVVVSDV